MQITVPLLTNPARRAHLRAQANARAASRDLTARRLERDEAQAEIAALLAGVRIPEQRGGS